MRLPTRLPVSRIGKLVFSLTSGTLQGTVDRTASDRAEQTYLNAMQAQGRQFTKQEVAYIAAFPAPVFWSYQCSQCRFWKVVDPHDEIGICDIVEGRISDVGFCVLWTPAKPVEPVFSWMKRLPEFPRHAMRAIANLVTDPFTR